MSAVTEALVLTHTKIRYSNSLFQKSFCYEFTISAL